MKQSHPYQEDATTDIHDMCYSRVTILANEVDKLSDALYETSCELEKYKQKCQDLEQLDKQQFVMEDNVYERLRLKTIEAEENISRYQRMLHVKSEQEQQIAKLVQELEAITQILEIKDQELFAAKTQFIKKTEELSDSLQQMYHMETTLKAVKEDKLKYIHEFQQKEQQLGEAQEQIQSLMKVKQQYNELLLDIDTVRRNYTDLVQQKQQEKQDLLAQIDVLRQMSEYTIQDIEEKYQKIISEIQNQQKNDINQAVRYATCQIEGELETLKNLSQTQYLQLQNQELQINQFKKNLQAQTQGDLFNKDQQIRELNLRQEQLQQQYQKVVNELNQWKFKLNNGEIIIYDDFLKGQLEAASQLRHQVNSLETENESVKKELKQQQDLNMKLAQQIQGLSSQVSQQNQLLSQKNLIQGNPVNQSDQNKLRYLLKIVTELQNEIKDRDQKINLLKQKNLIDSSKEQSNYYHIATEEAALKYL